MNLYYMTDHILEVLGVVRSVVTIGAITATGYVLCQLGQLLSSVNDAIAPAVIILQ